MAAAPSAAPLALAAAVATLSVATQCVAHAIGLPVLSALISPLHSLALLALLLFCHPALPPLLARVATLRPTLPPGPPARLASLLAADPDLAAALRTPSPPPPFNHTLLALAFSAAADLSASLASPAAALARELAGALAAATLAAATLAAPSPPPLRLVRAAAWLCAAAAGLALLEARPPLASPLAAAHAARLGASLVLAVRAAEPLLRPAAWAAAGGGDAAAARLPLVGALLRLAPWAVAWSAQGGHEALELCFERGGMVAFTAAAFLLRTPPDPTAAPSDGPFGGYQSIGELAAARRARREAAAKEPAPEPLMRESWVLAGGVQGMADHDQALQRDADGDEAHEFWEETANGGMACVVAAKKAPHTAPKR
ncbi:hypothetical protein AB1Y20_020716 [Prymnesium parvum]|uniref:Protein RFT1 homolog n=1 Tax=Prymnesium parvum TaxID=97485 RepID=A0AB34JUB3_PRYPA